MRILIIKLGAAGDVIRTTSILPGLREKYKKVKIDWLTRKFMSNLLIKNPNIDNIYYLDHLDETLKKRKYDLLINLAEDEKACLLINSIKALSLTGVYMHGKKIVYTPNSAGWLDLGLISRYGIRVANKMKKENRKTYQEIWYSILGLSYKKQRPYFPIKNQDAKFINNFKKKNKIKSNDIVLGMNPGSANRWWDKKLTIKDTINLINKIQNRHNAKIILLGGPNEIRRNRTILAKTKNVIDGGCNNTISQFGAIINTCKVLITSDSLALHIGVALNKKVLVFFSPTSPWEIELYNKGEIILPINKVCLSCYKRKCRIKPRYDLDYIVQLI